MRAASTAAFFALSTPTVATGTPGGICAIARIGDVAPEGGHVEDAAAVRHEPSVVEGGSRVEDERAVRLGLVDAVDGRPGVAALGIAAGGEHDRDRGAVGDGQLDPAHVATGRRRERGQEVALD